MDASRRADPDRALCPALRAVGRCAPALRRARPAPAGRRRPVHRLPPLSLGAARDRPGHRPAPGPRGPDRGDPGGPRRGRSGRSAPPHRRPRPAVAGPRRPPRPPPPRHPSAQPGKGTRHVPQHDRLDRRHARCRGPPPARQGPLQPHLDADRDGRSVAERTRRHDRRGTRFAWHWSTLGRHARQRGTLAVADRAGVLDARPGRAGACGTPTAPRARRGGREGRRRRRLGPGRGARGPCPCPGRGRRPRGAEATRARARARWTRSPIPRTAS